MNHGIDTGFLVAAEVVEHTSHQAARAKIAELVAAGDEFALAPQVLAEFIPVVTDAKRFTLPLNMDVARDLAQKWWTAHEVTHIIPGDAAMAQFFVWHRRHSLGRKRILDTLLAPLTKALESIRCLRQTRMILRSLAHSSALRRNVMAKG